MVNEWTREDLPDATELCRMSVYNIDVMVDRNLNTIVDHLNANHPKSDTDRWRRAHEIVEAERDQARASLHEACKVAQSYKVDAYQATERAEAAERDLGEWKARAEAAEGRLGAPVAAPENVEADPAVFVVRESEVAAVEVRRASDGWYADGAWLASADETAEWVRDRAAEMVVCAARNEAVARAIEAEQAADPLLDKAQEFAALADWELTDREAELLHAVAAHVLGREVK